MTMLVGLWPDASTEGEPPTNDSVITAVLVNQ
jgi:hypothetical protein